MSRRRISWSELPLELLTPIYDRLGTQTDICTYRSVCKAWRDSTTFSTRTKPLNLLSSLLPYKFTINEINFKEILQTSVSLTLVQCSVFIVQSLVDNKLPPWICDIKEFIPGKFRAPQMFPYDKSLNLAFFRVSEMGRFHTFKFNEKKEKVSPRDDVISLQRQRLDGSKVVLISNPKFGTFAEIIDFKAVALGNNDGNLQMISIKHGTASRVTGPYTQIYDDVVNFQGSIYAIDRRGRLYCMGYNDTKLKTVVSKSIVMGSGCDTKKLLAVDMRNDELYVVHWDHCYMKPIFKVHKMNFESKKWDEVAGIGVDRILVVIHERCFFTIAKYIPGLGGNCIIYRNADFHAYNANMAKDMPGVFSFQDGSCKNVGNDTLYHRFCPTPSWVSNNTKLFNSLSIPRALMIKNICNHVFSESSCTPESRSAEAILHLRDQLKGLPGTRRTRGLFNDHVEKMLAERKRQKLVEEEQREKEEARKKIALLEKELDATKREMKEMTQHMNQAQRQSNDELQETRKVAEIIDTEDEKIKKLREKWGDDVYDEVTTALLELNESSGRYATNELRNHKKGRKATIKEVASYIFKRFTLKRRS